MVRAAALLALAGACTPGLEESAPAVALDVDHFRCAVQPVLAARCAFAECHASARRPLRVYAVGRMRYDVGWDRLEAPLTPKELADNHRAAAGFATASDGDAPLLLAKPLDTRAGGYYHRGQDLYGEDDVFLTTDDPGYRLLADWIGGADLPADCVPTQAVGP